MTPRKRTARIGSFDALEDRVVLSLSAMAQNEAIVKDVTAFYANYVATVPTLVQALTSTAAGSTAQTTAATNLTNAITTDVNNLGTQLLGDLGPASVQSIRTSITGADRPGGHGARLAGHGDPRQPDERSSCRSARPTRRSWPRPAASTWPPT